MLQTILATYSKQYCKCVYHRQHGLNATSGDHLGDKETSEGLLRPVLSVAYTFILLFVVCCKY